MHLYRNTKIIIVIHWSIFHEYYTNFDAELESQQLNNYFFAFVCFLRGNAKGTLGER